MLYAILAQWPVTPSDALAAVATILAIVSVWPARRTLLLAAAVVVLGVAFLIQGRI